ncbi:MAG TPA: nitroreductase family protein [Candidatus Limnocylindrales bacterium]|nr:nitroreductase family protein [Candidatus Limnocylindrales bacterium]
MTDAETGGDRDSALDRLALVRPLVRTRQYREFTDRPLPAAALDAILDAARWSGSSQNQQPWRFVLIRDEGKLRRIAEAGLPQTRSLRTATAAIAIVLPDDPARELSLAYDDGRVAERILIAASMVGFGGGIAWVRRDARPIVAEALALPADRTVRTIVSLGEPTQRARAPKSAPGTARLPRDEVVFDERWPTDT